MNRCRTRTATKLYTSIKQFFMYLCSFPPVAQTHSLSHVRVLRAIFCRTPLLADSVLYISRGTESLDDNITKYSKNSVFGMNIYKRLVELYQNSI
jgi:hypothetical protein